MKLELKMFYKTYTAHKPPKYHPQRRNGAIHCCPLLRDIICSQHVLFHHCQG